MSEIIEQTEDYLKDVNTSCDAESAGTVRVRLRKLLEHAKELERRCPGAVNLNDYICVRLTKTGLVFAELLRR